MSVTQTTSKYNHSGSLQCSRCHSPLPEKATFCGSCGERVEKKTHSSLSFDASDVADRYRITSLVRRRPYVQLFLAIDTSNSRPVAMRDIDISSLDDDAQVRALDATQHEYDLLRSQHIPDIMPVIDLRYFRDHLFVVQRWPFASKGDDASKLQQHRTLHDLLQSGIGLPDEEIAVTWVYRLCHAIERLHSQQIVISDLDPHAIVVSDDDYTGLPALMVSWLPAALRGLLMPVSAYVNTGGFAAPEAFSGHLEPRSDIYSLGALLYLLLTGTAPAEIAEHASTLQRSPRDLNSRVSSKIDAVVVRALSTDPAKRFQSATELSETLLHLYASTRPVRSGKASAKEIEKHEKHEKQKASTKEKPPLDADETETVAETVTVAPHEAYQASQQLEYLTKKQSLKETPQKDDADEETQAATQQVVKQQSRKESVSVEAKKADEAPTFDIATIPTFVFDRQEVEDEVARAKRQKKQTPRRDIATEATLLLNKQQIRDEIGRAKENTAQKSKSQELLDAAATVNKRQSAETPAVSKQDISREPVQKDIQQKQAAFSLIQNVRQRLTGILPALPSVPALPQLIAPKTVRSLSPLEPTTATEGTFLKKLQGFFLGVQQRATTDVALIELPLRVQPNQSYSLRIQLMGRDEPGLPPGVEPGTELAGLSALAYDDLVHIEVRSSLYQKYAYIVQQADVFLPKQGYAAEVTIPLRSLADGAGGRRERLYIHFMDESHQPLYEKPFVIEIFISPLVQSGREGHNVLSIPL